MHIGYLFYTNSDAEKNLWFIKNIISIGKQFDCDVKLLITDDNFSFEDISYAEERLQNKKNCFDANVSMSQDCCPEFLRMPLPNFVINRSRNLEITLYYEDKDVLVFNDYEVSYIGDDKYAGYLFAKGLGIPVMKTKRIVNSDVLFERDLTLKAKYKKKVPFVLKTLDGHGGLQVQLCSNEIDVKSLPKSMTSRPLILQKVANCIIDKHHGKDFVRDNDAVNTTSRDMRIYVIGNEIFACVLRENANSFVSNYSLGGSAKVVPIDKMRKDIVKYVKKILSRIKCDFVGIDFIFHDGGAVFNEIENVVGCRMLYQIAGMDPLKRFFEIIVQKLAKKKEK